eukprot:7390689-Prymnesium_polylepis.1
MRATAGARTESDNASRVARARAGPRIQHDGRCARCLSRSSPPRRSTVPRSSGGPGGARGHGLFFLIVNVKAQTTSTRLRGSGQNVNPQLNP